MSSIPCTASISMALRIEVSRMLSFTCRLSRFCTQIIRLDPLAILETLDDDDAALQNSDTQCARYADIEGRGVGRFVEIEEYQRVTGANIQIDQFAPNIDPQQIELT